MAKPELGDRHVCQNCGTRYYDLKRKPPTCPKCETALAVEKPKARRVTAAAAAKAAAIKPDKADAEVVTAPPAGAVEVAEDAEEIDAADVEVDADDDDDDDG